MSSKFRKNCILAATLIVASSLASPAFSQQVTRELRVPIDSTSLRTTAGPGMIVTIPKPSLSEAEVRALVRSSAPRDTCGSVVYYRFPDAEVIIPPPPRFDLPEYQRVVTDEACQGQSLLQPTVRVRARCVADGSLAGGEGGQIGYNGCPSVDIYTEQITELAPACPSGLFLTSAQNSQERLIRFTCVVPG